MTTSPSVLVGEFLEQHALLSAVTVTTISDTSNDGDTSSIAALLLHPGTDRKVSLREAIRAANNSEGTNTITFDPNLMARDAVNVAPRQLDDITADNSAFAITSTLTIIGAPNSNLITLKGTGPQGDLRLFRVLAEGNLTLQGLNFTNWSTDTNGAVLAVDPRATVTIKNCVLSNNMALSQGEAIFNSFGDVTLIDSQLTGNRAHDGGAIFSGIGGGATSGNIVQVGGPGGESLLRLVGSTFTGNSAQHRGGAVFIIQTNGEIADCLFSRNRALLGGGVFQDTSEIGFFHNSNRPDAGNYLGITIHGTRFSANIAESTVGGVFNGNGATTDTGSTFIGNVPQQGAALYNDLGWAALTDSIVKSNVSRRGTQLFNHLGIMPLSNPTIGDVGKMRFLSTNDGTSTRFVATDSGSQPSVVSPPPRNAIVTAPDGIQYALTSKHLLIRQIPGCSWSILDDLVVSYRIAPNGECT